MAEFNKSKAKINVSIKIGDSLTSVKAAAGVGDRVVNEKVLIAVFRTFEGLNGSLISHLSKIKAAAPKGMKEAFTAYGEAWKAAKKTIEDRVRKLTPEELGWAWKGLELSSPGDKHVSDVTDSIMLAWDKAASKYVKNEVLAGDAEAAKILPRLQEFDSSLSSKGAFFVKKDS